MEGINPGRTHNQSSDFASWDMKGKAPENGDIRSSGVTESNILELDISYNMLRFPTYGAKRIDGRFTVDENKELRCGGGAPAKHDGIRGDGSDGYGGDNNRVKDTISNDHVSRAAQSEEQDIVISRTQVNRKILGEGFHARNYGTNIADLTPSNHGEPLPESKAHPCKYDEVFGGKQHSVKLAFFIPKPPRFVKILRVFGHHPRPEVKGVRGTDTT